MFHFQYDHLLKLLKEFNPPWVKVTLGKPGAVTGSKEVGVIIERTQDRD